MKKSRIFYNIPRSKRIFYNFRKHQKSCVIVISEEYSYKPANYRRGGIGEETGDENGRMVGHEKRRLIPWDR